MNEKMIATLSIERELKDELQIIEYGIGSGDFHFHSRLEICIVSEGTVDALVNNRNATLEKGDIAVAFPYDPHRYIAKEGVRYSVLIVPSDIGERFCADMKSSTHPFVRNSERSAAVMEYLSRLKCENIGELERIGLVYLILGAVKNELLSGEKQVFRNDELLNELLLYIHKNYGKNLTLSSISKAFGYHPAYVSSYFKSRLNIGISRYINVIRLNNAVLLMRKNKHTTTQIALECGFNSLRTFYRVFKSEFLCSPREYLERSENK